MVSKFCMDSPKAKYQVAIYVPDDGSGWNGLFSVQRLQALEETSTHKCKTRVQEILFIFFVKGGKHIKAEMLSSLLKVQVNQWSNWK